MLTMETETDGTVVLKVSDKLTKEDYDRCVPELERLAQASGPLRILIRLHDFHGWDLGALWEELKFDTTHQGDLGRVAVVGEKTWHEWGTRLSKPFFKAEVRYFDHHETPAARTWLSRP